MSHMHSREWSNLCVLVCGDRQAGKQSKFANILIELPVYVGEKHKQKIYVIVKIVGTQHYCMVIMDNAMEIRHWIWKNGCLMLKAWQTRPYIRRAAMRIYSYNGTAKCSVILDYCITPYTWMCLFYCSIHQIYVIQRYCDDIQSLPAPSHILNTFRISD